MRDASMRVQPVYDQRDTGLSPLIPNLNSKFEFEIEFECCLFSLTFLDGIRPFDLVAGDGGACTGVLGDAVDEGAVGHQDVGVARCV